MLEDLAVAIENLDAPADRESLVEAIALRDRLNARITEAVGEFETNGWWCVDAAASMTAWLRANALMTRRSAQRLRSTAMRLRSLPVCARAYADGTLSGGQIEAIVARLDDETVEVFATQEAELVPYLVPLTVAGVSHAMAAWVSRARPEPSEPKEPERALHLSRTLEDRWVLDGTLDPEGGAIVAAALRLATPEQADVAAEPAARRADALVDVCRFFLDHQRSRAGGRHRPHVNVVVELEDLLAGRGGRVVDGPSLDGASVSRLFCDSAVHRVVMAGRSSVSTTAPPPAPSPLPCGTPWSFETSTAGSRAVTAPRCGARATTWCGSPRTGRPSWPIWCWCAPGTTTSSTSPAGTPSSAPTARSTSPIPTATSAARHRRALKSHGDGPRNRSASFRFKTGKRALSVFLQRLIGR